MPQQETEPPEWLGLVREKVQGLRCSVVQIVVPDWKVIQSERTRKNAWDAREKSSLEN